MLDETKTAIKKTVNEAKKEIPKYIRAIGDLQEETIQAIKEIGADCYRIAKGNSIFNSTASGKICVILYALDVSENSSGIKQQND